jgi:AraC family transcriptional regulator
MQKQQKNNKLFVKNMVCQRCILTVKTILEKYGVVYDHVILGEASLAEEIKEKTLKDLDYELKKFGFELIETRINKLIEGIKKLVLDYLNDDTTEQKRKLSSFISSRLHYDYSYLSDLFSSIEGTTIEKYFIIQRIEKVKELLVYDELSLTEISYRTGFSSVHHLSAQFKKETGFNASHFKKIGAQKRKAIDSI